MRLLVLREIGPGGGLSSSSRVVSCGTTNLVVDETFVVLDVFCPLDWGEIDSVNVPCYQVPRVFLDPEEVGM